MPHQYVHRRALENLPLTPSSSEKSTFQPVHPFDLENPRSWAETAGTMDWDTTHICFTKRSLLDFLK